MSSDSDRGPLYGLGAILLLLGLLPGAWVHDWPCGLALVAFLPWLPALHRRGITRPASLAALLLAAFALLWPPTPNLPRVEPVLEDVVLRTVDDAEWIAADPWLAEALAGGSRAAAFEHLDAVAPESSAEDAVGCALFSAEGVMLAWSGWTAAVAAAGPELEPESGTHVEVRVDEPYTLVRAWVPLAGGATIVVGRPLAVVAPLRAGGIQPEVPDVEGLSFHDTLFALPPGAAFDPLGEGGIARLEPASRHEPMQGSDWRARAIAPGILLALLLAARAVRRRDGLRGLLLGWSVLLLARFLLLDTTFLGDAVRDPSEFAALLPPGWPESIGDVLGSPGDATLTFLALNLALALALRNVSSWARANNRRLPTVVVVPALALVAGATVLWASWTRAFAAAAGRPPFVDITALGDPAVLLVGISVALLGLAYALCLLVGHLAYVAALPPLRRHWALVSLPILLAFLAAGPPSTTAWMVALTAAALLLPARAFLAQRPVLGPDLVAVVMLIGLASAAILKEQQREDFQYFAEEHARRTRLRESFEVSLLESALEDMIDEGGLRRALEGQEEAAQAAFHAWLVSGLAAGQRPCEVQVRDATGVVLSRFRLDMPVAVEQPVGIVVEPTGAGEIAIRRNLRRAGRREWEVLIASAEVPSAAGPGHLTVAILPDGPALLGSGTGALSRRLSRWGADPVVLRYRNGVLVDSNAPDAPIGDLLPAITRDVFSQEDGEQRGGWRDVELQDRRYRIFWTLQPDGEVLGLGLPVGLHADLATLALNSVAIHGIVILTMAICFALVSGWGARIPHLLGQFRVRLMMAIVAVAVFPIFFWGSVGVQRLMRESDDAQRADLELKLDAALGVLELDLAMELGRSLESLSQLLAAGDERWEEGVRAEAPHWLPPGLDGGLVYDAEGVERERAGSTAPVPPVVLRAVLNQGESRTFYQSLTGDPAVVLAQPVTGPRGKVLGCVVGFRRLSTQVCERLHALLMSEVRIYGRDELAATSRPELARAGLVPSWLPADVWRALVAQGRPGMVLNEVGSLGTRLASYRALRLGDVVAVGAMAVSRPHLSAWAGDREVSRSISLIVSLSALWLALSVAAGLVLSRRISGPLQRVIHGAGEIAGGALGMQVQADGRDELARLAHAFNRMSRSLADNRDELEAQRAALETIIQHLEAGVIATKADGWIQLSNHAADRFLGGGEPLRGSVEPLLQASDLTGVEALLEAFRRTGSYAGELPFGADRTMRISMTRIGGHGAAGRVLVVLEDLTDLIRSQKTLAWAQMARQVAHEIKNPLTPMKLQAQNLLYAHAEQPERFGETLHESVGVIIEQIERLRRISGEFSRMARPETLGSESIDLTEAVSDVLRIYAGTENDSITMRQEIGTGLPKVRIQREDLTRMVLNLVENARDAVVNAAAKEVKVRLAATRDGAPGVRLEVRDNGPGIPDAVRSQLFEPYFSTKTAGTGLGLAIAKKIVEGCGGYIEVSSDPREGTVFSVSLPAAEE